MAGTVLQNCYAPTWLEYFDRNGEPHDGVTVAVDCGICDLQLAITQAPDETHETFAVLPCGHAFGHACISEWFDFKTDCPQCRKDMRHPYCGHPAAIAELQGGSGFNVHRDLPPVLSANQDLSGDCGGCHVWLQQSFGVSIKGAPQVLINDVDIYHDSEPDEPDEPYEPGQLTVPIDAGFGDLFAESLSRPPQAQLRPAGYNPAPQYREAPAVGVQPVETQPVEAQLVEAQPVEAQPAEAQPAVAQPAEAQPAETQEAEMDEDRENRDPRPQHREIHVFPHPIHIGVGHLREYLAQRFSEGHRYPPQAHVAPRRRAVPYPQPSLRPSRYDLARLPRRPFRPLFTHSPPVRPMSPPLRSMRPYGTTCYHCYLRATMRGEPVYLISPPPRH